jgi:LmbE family N-acetylglucosaminyl deacetylase
LVFAPSLNDIHQDHSVVAREALRAFKNITILGYEMPWNNIDFQTKVFIKLDAAHLDLKVEALKCYKSQEKRSYLNEEFIRALAKTRGVQIESDIAESFEVMRLVI